MNKSEQSLRDLWNTIKSTNIIIVEISQEKKKCTQHILKTNSKKLLNLRKDTSSQIQNFQQTPNELSYPKTYYNETARSQRQ